MNAWLMVRYSIILILADWKGRKRCASREFKSLIWHLQHVAKVVCPGRRLIRGIIATRNQETPSLYSTMLNASFQSGFTYNVIIESSTQTPLLHGAMKCHGKATGSNSHGHPSHPLHQHQLLPENYSQWCSQQVHVHVCGAITGQVRLFCAISTVRL